MMISVIIPLYNKERSIVRTIKSVLNQNNFDFEIVVVDDGSTDNSVNLVESIQDSRIRIVKQENGGPSRARNTGINNAKGEWIIFLDADDILLPNALETFNTLISNYPSQKCFSCNFYMEHKGRRMIYSYFYSQKLIKHPFWFWDFKCFFPRAGASLYHKDITNEFHFNNDLRRYEDAEWLFRIMRKNEFVRSPVPVMIYNLNTLEASAKRKDINEDYLGHLNFIDGSLGEQLANYQFYKKAKKLYPQEYISIYSNRIRWDRWLILECLYVISSMFAFFVSIIKKVCRKIYK